MTYSSHVVLHITPDGRSLPVRDDKGRLILFAELANAETFARALVTGGVPDVVLADLRDLDSLCGPPASDVATVFEDGVAALDADARRQAAHELALALAPSLARFL